MNGEEVGTASTKLVEELKSLKVGGVLKVMAQQGQLVELRCEIPKCYCPGGRRKFDPKGQVPNDWTPSVDHYPKLKSEGGTRIASNVRIGHVLCNREDFSWRKRIATLLDRGKSLQEIADELNRKNVPTPHGHANWSAAMVRKAFVS